MKWKLLLVALFAAAGCAPTQGSNDQSVEPARAEARTWLQLVDADRYEESWAETGTLFRQQVSAQQWAAAAAGARAPYGALVSREITRANAHRKLPGVPEGNYVVVQTSAQFGNKSAVETITLVSEEDRWRVVGYFIK